MSLNALETLKARNVDLETQITNASATHSALTAQITALSTERDALKASMAEHESSILAITTERDGLKASLAESVAKVADLSAKEQDLQKRASALATQTMASVGQPPVATTTGTENKPKIDPKLTGRDRVQASIEARLKESGVTLRNGKPAVS